MAKIYSGTSNVHLAKKIADRLGVALSKPVVKPFGDKEPYVRIEEDLKNETVFIMQSDFFPVEVHTWELLMLIDAAKRWQPKKIVVVLFFYPFRRQERMNKPGECVTAELVAKCIETAGVDALVVLDLHNPEETKKFFTIPVEEIKTTSLIVDYFKGKKIENLVILTPDLGSRARTRAQDYDLIAKELEAERVEGSKFRPAHDVARASEIKGEVEKKNVLVVEDEISTGGTLKDICKVLTQRGCLGIYVFATHPVFAPKAIPRLRKISKIKEVVVTDSIPLSNTALNLPKIKVISVAELFAEKLKFYL